MLLKEEKTFDFFVSSRIGSFKHIKYHTDVAKNNKKCIENLVDVKTLQKDDTITCMEWGNKEQTEILIGKRNQKIETYSTEKGFTSTETIDFGSGDIVGLGRYKRRLIAGVASGVVKIWGKKEDTLVETGGKIDRMKVWSDGNVFATGGEENDLKLWRIGETAPIFIAKNLPHDWLQLRRPVWVTDLTFLEENLLAVCSRHGYVRLYDTRVQRRPICNVDTKGMAATCIANGFDERQVLVGFGRGQLHQVDFRHTRLDKGYKGAAGAITSIAVCDKMVISTSLDRHIRVHEHSSKNCVYRQYLTSKLTKVLVQTATSTPLQNSSEDVKEEEQEITIKDDDLDEIFENMETVGIKTPRKKHLEEDTEVEAKKCKPSTEGSTEVTSGEDAIVKLLRSTEKQKRRLEKKKREKKAKSVFHNA
ncbi:WD repeat-containing protein 74 [Colias croceus]|uniref:WD repeat-containing protein 74 n=1 Tax=Colias crocea TaxID=72248 RepID=UPI001E27C237|nr:WD repeat-containing protein 74 [Colias croceus]